MRPSRADELRRAFLTGALAVALVTPGAGFAEEPAAARRLNWETGEGKSYLIPALEVGGFVFGLNQFNRHFIDRDTYGTDAHSVWKNLTSRVVIEYFSPAPKSSSRLGQRLVIDSPGTAAFKRAACRFGER
jgi:hypothetical protein